VAAVIDRRPDLLGLALPCLGGLEIGSSHCETGDGHRMASQRLSALLVLEESRPSRSPPVGVGGRAGTDSTHECGKPPLGCAADSRWLGKLGIKVSETTVAKYMVRHRSPPSQTWPTFLTNHVKDLVSADFFVVPTATFRLLFVCDPVS